MNRNEVPEVTTLNWKEEDGVVIINTGYEKIMLNITSSIIWNMINGINSIQDIIDEMIKQYSEENSESYLIELVETAINDFINNKIAILRTTSEFDGWLQYE